MAAFVVLSLALAVVLLATVVVVARDLVRTVGKLQGAVRAASQRLAPLTEELTQELAVTGTEVEALTRHLDDARTGAKDLRRRPRRSGIRRRRR